MKGKLIKQKGIGFQTIDGSDYFLTIDEKVYHTNPLTAGLVDGGKLSYKNCQAIERGYDLDELAYEHYDIHIKRGHTEEDSLQRKIDFILGFQKALELMGDKKFSEDDMRKAIEIARKGSMQEQHNGYGMSTGSIFVLDNLSFDEFIQSQQQTEWDVEFEMEYVGECNGNNDNGCFQDSPGHNCGCFERKPKLDDEGCLILKKYKNG